MTALSAELRNMIDRIVAIHGEEGVCRTAEEWEGIMQRPQDEPIGIINLLKFKKVVQSPEGEISGWKAYNQYMASAGPAFLRVGGERIFYGRVCNIFPYADKAEWDTAISTRYPTPLALANFWLDEEFIKAHTHRVEGVEQGQVLLLELH